LWQTCEAVFQPGIIEEIDMTEKKLKPAAKKTTTSKAKAGTKKSGAASGKSEGVKTTVAKKTAVKKTAPTKTVTAAAKKTKAAAVKKAPTPAAVKKTPAKKAPAAQASIPRIKPAPREKANASSIPSPEERYRMVETAAYFIAEQHGFQGRSDEHWAAAEREIAAKLGC
jgi:DNA polymerase III gamma/tau subunit